MEAATRQDGSPSGRLFKTVASEWPFTLVFATAVAGVAVVALGDVKRGLTLLAGALLAGSLLRFVLPASRAGLLAVRRRGVDVVTMALLGAVLLMLVAVADVV